MDRFPSLPPFLSANNEASLHGVCHRLWGKVLWQSHVKILIALRLLLLISSDCFLVQLTLPARGRRKERTIYQHKNAAESAILAGKEGLEKVLNLIPLQK